MFDSAKILLRNNLISISKKFLSGKSIFTKPGTLLIVRTDGIGDYVLFRNFLKEIKQSPKFREFKVTLLGNIIWKEMAETFDKDWVDNFIWIDNSKFLLDSEWGYRLSNLFRLYMLGFEYIILPNNTSNHLTNLIKDFSGAKNKISKESDAIFFYEGLESHSLNGKSKVDSKRNSLFQFNRNRIFIEEITGTRIEISRPYFEIGKNNSEEEYIVIFPGAGYFPRKWSAENFAVLCRMIDEKYKIKMIICGDDTDKLTALHIMKESKSENIEDKTGRLKLSELVNVISNARLLISNETCAVHIAAAAGTDAICISNGNHYGRFNPYPEEISESIKTIYPDEINDTNEDFEQLVKRFHISSDLDINGIKPEAVFEKAVEMLEVETEKK